MEPTLTRPPLPKTAWIAAGLAFLTAAYLILMAFLGMIILLPAALIPLLAGIGILRRNIWSGRGYAIYLIASFLTVLVLIGGMSTSIDRFSAIGTGLFSLLQIALFLDAARALGKADGHLGRPHFWVAVSVLFVLPWFFFQAFRIPSASMEDTLLLGDSVLVQHSPKPVVARGDVVVFPYPLNPKEYYTKRVVGMTGDRIRIVNKALYRNGSLVNEPYAKHLTSYIDAYRDNFPSGPVNFSLPPAAVEMLSSYVANGELVVPDGKLFVLGDNRDDSSDSRYWGFVDASTVFGKPVLIYNSVESPASDALDRPGRGRVRWNRLFRVVR
jgi:signal peptidase I